MRRDLGINAVGAEVQGDHVAELLGAVGEHGGAHVSKNSVGTPSGCPGVCMTTGTVAPMNAVLATRWVP
jgi:hypothetical protein